MKTTQFEKERLMKMYNGVTHKQELTQYELITKIMEQGFRTKKKLYWYAYELMGYWTIDKKRYFMSYKACTRVSEMIGLNMVTGEKSSGKLHFYALTSILSTIDILQS